MDFGVNGAVKMTVLTNGNVGVGTTNPTYNLNFARKSLANNCWSNFRFPR